MASTLPEGVIISNDQVSWLAPPDSLSVPATPVAPGYQAATERVSSSSIIFLQISARQ
ncbi:MAG: hypothetical protein WBF12_08720 [Bradyrhizobium sp.]